MARVAVIFALAVTTALCAYLLISMPLTDAFGSEPLYWENAGRALGHDWTQGYAEWIHNRLGETPLSPDAAADYGQSAMIYFAGLRLLVDDLQTFGAAHNVLMGRGIRGIGLGRARHAHCLCALDPRNGWRSSLRPGPSLSRRWHVGGVSLRRAGSVLCGLLLLATRARPSLAAVLIGIGARIKL